MNADATEKDQTRECSSCGKALALACEVEMDDRVEHFWECRACAVVVVECHVQLELSVPYIRLDLTP